MYERKGKSDDLGCADSDLRRVWDHLDVECIPCMVAVVGGNPGCGKLGSAGHRVHAACPACSVKNTKFWVTVGVEAGLIVVLLLLIFTNHLEGNFVPWLAAFVGVPTQYGLFNVIASGQAAGVPTEK